MKFLLKVFVVTVAAKYVLQTPKDGSSGPLDRFENVTVRDITQHVDTVFARIEATLKSMLS